jgi:hypothetical protein
VSAEFFGLAGELGADKLDASVKLKERIVTRKKVVADLAEAKRASMLTMAS